MKAFGVTHNRRTIGGLASDLDGVFNRLGARVDEHRFRVARFLWIGVGEINVRQQLSQLLTQGDVGLLGGDLKTSMQQLTGLLGNRFDNARLAMSSVHHFGRVVRRLSSELDGFGASGLARLGAASHRWAGRRRGANSGSGSRVDVAVGASWSSCFTILGFLAIGLGFLGSPQIFVRFLSLRSEQEIRPGAIVAVIWTLLATLGAVLVGMLGRALLMTPAQSMTDELGQGGQLVRSSRPGIIGRFK